MGRYPRVFGSPAAKKQARAAFAAKTPTPTPTPTPTQRIVPVDANNFWVMVANDRNTAFGYRFTRGAATGGASAADVGGNWQPWRIAAEMEFASLSANPTSATPVWVTSNDNGARNYAFSRVAGVFMGSYHGGETLNGAMLVQMDGADADPTVAKSGSGFMLRYSSVITDGTVTINVTNYQIVFNAAGVPVVTCDSISRDQTLFRSYIGHLIGTGDIWSEGIFRVAGEATDRTIPVEKAANGGNTDYFLPVSSALSLRDPVSGRRVRMVSNFTSANMRRGEFLRYVGAQPRHKAYNDNTVGTGAMTISNIQIVTTYEVGATGATSFAANALTDPGFSGSLAAPWTSSAGTNGSIVFTGGVARFTRADSNDVRLWQAVNGSVGQLWLFAASQVAAPAGVKPALAGAVASNGSIISPNIPAFDQAFGDVGRVGYVFPFTQATHYLHMRLGAQSGQAQQVADLDDALALAIAA